MKDPVTADWNEDGTVGLISGRALVHCLRLVSDWYLERSVEASNAWVVEFMTTPDDLMQRSLIELSPEPATTVQRKKVLLERALEVAALGVPAVPEPFAQAPIGITTKVEIRNQVELISHSLQDAIGRVDRATRQDIEWAATAISAAVVEVMAWLRALDEVLGRIWRLPELLPQRESISKQVDEYLANRPHVSGLVTDTEKERRESGKPYDDWAVALISRGESIPRQELIAFRWLAGKVLHQGPLSVAELSQWRAGQEPIWKWRKPGSFLPANKTRDRNALAKVFEETVSGKSIRGSLNFTTALFEAEFLFFSLLRDPG